MAGKVKAMVFPVVMYGCDSWAIKKAERQRIDAFELWYWRRLLRVLWTARRSNQSIPKEINPEYSLEGLMMKMKLQFFGHLMRRADSLEKTLMLGKIKGRKIRGQRRMRWLDAITDSMDMSLRALGDGDGQGSLPWGTGVAKSCTQLSDWTPPPLREFSQAEVEHGIWGIIQVNKKNRHTSQQIHDSERDSERLMSNKWFWEKKKKSKWKDGMN